MPPQAISEGNGNKHAVGHFKARNLRRGTLSHLTVNVSALGKKNTTCAVSSGRPSTGSDLPQYGNCQEFRYWR